MLPVCAVHGDFPLTALRPGIREGLLALPHGLSRPQAFWEGLACPMSATCASESQPPEGSPINIICERGPFPPMVSSSISPKHNKRRRRAAPDLNASPRKRSQFLSGSLITPEPGRTQSLDFRTSDLDVTTGKRRRPVRAQQFPNGGKIPEPGLVKLAFMKFLLENGYGEACVPWAPRPRGARTAGRNDPRALPLRVGFSSFSPI